MDVLMVGCSQTKVGKWEVPVRRLGFCKPQQICATSNKVSSKRRSIGVALNTIRAELSSAEVSPKTRVSGKLGDRVKLFVGLPLDAVSDCSNLNHTKAITAGLKALKLLGVEGVELPIWWGIVEKEVPGQYDWSANLALAEMVQEAGLKLRVSICFHASTEPAFALPQWVSQIGETQQDIFFTDRSGRQYKGCLSFSVDDLPVLNGNTPIQVYERLLKSFQCSFSSFIGSTITEISVSLGPNGELRYPSFSSSARSCQSLGVGEFQCYDKHMLNHLQEHADASGNRYWGLSGPHDGPTYYQSPDSSGFCKPIGGSWETPYGDFFLSWYSNQLVSHGDRVLSVASSIFKSSSVIVSGKIPLVHSWYGTRSHPAELTAGFYNTVNRDGYEPVVEMFARNSCKMVLPGLDLSNNVVPQTSQSSPDSLVSQIMEACKKYGVWISGENSSSLPPVSRNFENIKEKISSSPLVSSFTYQRMGAYFFAPEHFPLFIQFIRSLMLSEPHVDNLPCNGEQIFSPKSSLETERDLQMLAA